MSVVILALWCKSFPRPLSCDGNRLTRRLNCGKNAAVDLCLRIPFSGARKLESRLSCYISMNTFIISFLSSFVGRKWGWRPIFFSWQKVPLISISQNYSSHPLTISASFYAPHIFPKLIWREHPEAAADQKTSFVWLQPQFVRETQEFGFQKWKGMNGLSTVSAWDL